MTSTFPDTDRDAGTPALRTQASVRLLPVPGTRGRRWRAVRLDRPSELRVDRRVAQVLLAFMRPRPPAESLRDLERIGGVPRAVTEGIVERLRQAGFLVGADDEQHVFAARVMSAWRAHGWAAAADHHLATYDYPFVDYSGKGFGADLDRMSRYAAAEPDTSRTKTYERTLARLAAPAPRAALETLREPFARFWQRPADEGLAVLDRETLVALLSITFGRLRGRRMRHRENRADLIRKTSPSGGSRHPTEGYALVTDVAGLAPGVYHFNVKDNALDRIGAPIDAGELRRAMYGPDRAPFPVNAYVVLTSVFERNMYRYREPRTARTVFMDVGHLLTTLEVTAKAHRIACFPHRGIEVPALEDWLGVVALEEGPLFAAALGGRSS